MVVELVIAVSIIIVSLLLRLWFGMEDFVQKMERNQDESFDDDGYTRKTDAIHGWLLYAWCYTSLQRNTKDERRGKE